MIHVYLDDWRRCPAGFALAKNMEECLLLLEEEEVGILSLDHDLGPGEPTGTELVMEMVRRKAYPSQAIYLHTSSLIGKQRMYELLYTSKPEHVQLISGPMPDAVLERVRVEHDR
ncbi:cyclic-phosphate processing receiver domain-containing protein [Paenibacillus sp. 481]|uniref:cyclic-phosphate processing receiver domain-containing protein n=1 Tax=Paenibacillus sp. 481 TaxID=2835869 RepID=UPI001E5F4FB1|nr:cyclic-phosphate processing receiver domain-containing protein [Paenibacillus sp. 481]UHA73098.1 cell division protein FtsJ [Paenibacillus sp. 481]